MRMIFSENRFALFRIVSRAPTARDLYVIAPEARNFAIDASS